MKARIYKFFIIFIIINSKSQSAESYQTVVSQDDESSEFFLKLWKHQNNEYTKDMSSGFMLLAEIEKQEQILSELKQTTKIFLMEESAKKCSRILSGQQTMFQRQEFQEIIKNLLEHFSQGKVEAILSSAIKLLYTTKSPETLFDNLCYIWQECDTNPANNSENFELMIKSQLILYKLYQTEPVANNDEYFKKFAYLLYKIRKNKSYSNIGLNLQTKIDSITWALPDSFAIFKPYFCMMNEKTREYIYTAVSAEVAANSRFIWLWHQKGSIDDTGHITAENIEINTNDKTWNVTLLGTLYNLYYYIMARKDLLIAGLNSSAQARYNHIWHLKYLQGNKIVLSQSGLIMCSDSRHDKERGNVNAFANNAKYNENNKICQWSIGSCNRS